ncbi:amidohydrolase family protein [Paraburkholderia xenovorans]|uniref:amidohydrolase family protein n=1 Tax=Paraburkholderia xenovorans TaxID=36873 RepID=UPI0015596D74
MEYVDTHFHLWDLKANYYPWLTDRILTDHVLGDYSAIRKDYLISDLLADIAATPVRKGVHIQANIDPQDPVRETKWLQHIADDTVASRGFPHAIVAFAPLESPDAERVIAAHKESPNVRGLRQVLPQDVLDHATFCRNLALLPAYQLSFDLQIRHPHMAVVAELAARNPDLQLIVTHCGYPLSTEPAYLAAWRAGMRKLAEYSNVAVKLSGFAFIDPHWTADSLRPLVLEIIDIFGPHRCMFATDFPVDKVAGEYHAYWAAYETITAQHSEAERSGMLGGNAERIYRI